MENKNLMQDVIEKWGEETQMDMIVEKSLLLALAIQDMRRIERKEDHLSYSIAYNEVCERIADMRLMVEQAEFLFNTNEINNHYHNKVQNLVKELNEF
jgi:hypothetical protein